MFLPQQDGMFTRQLCQHILCSDVKRVKAFVTLPFIYGYHKNMNDLLCKKPSHCTTVCTIFKDILQTSYTMQAALGAI